MPDRRPLILLAPGAGAPSTSGWMRAWAKRLGEIGEVEAFDYPHMREGRKTPDRQPRLIAAHREAIAEARARHGADRPIVLAGKSMGGRIGCHVAVELADQAAEGARDADARRGAAVVTALVCFGYPLVGAGTGARRDAVLLALATPVLFVQGSRDPLCPLAELASVRERMRTRNELFEVEGGDHSLALRKMDERATGRTQDEWNDAMTEAVRDFVASAMA